MLCMVCQKKVVTRCITCKSACFCSQECQNLNWKSHKKFCCSFAVKEEEEEKDGLKLNLVSIVAAKDLKGGDYILEEFPWFYIPRVSKPKPEKEKKDYENCVSCGLNLCGFSSGKCTKCKWPVCGENCEKHKIHAENECEILASRKIDYDSLAVHEDRRVLLILRTQAVKEKNPDLWEELMKRADKISKAGQNSKINREEISKLENAMKKLKISNEEVEEYKRFFSLLNLTSISYEAFAGRVNLKGEKRIQSRVGDFLYPLSNYFSFSCAPNCNFAIEDGPDFRIQIRAARNIKKGEELSIHHPLIPLFEDTIERRRIIKERFGYLCKCKRCSDPTEFGTFFSGIACTECRNQPSEENQDKDVGYFLPLDLESALEKEEDFSSLLQCNGCKMTRPYSFFENQLTITGEALLDYEDNVHVDDNSLPSMEIIQDKLESVKLILSEFINGKITHSNHVKIYKLQTRLRELYMMGLIKSNLIGNDEARIKFKEFLEGVVDVSRIQEGIENKVLNGSVMFHQCQLQERIAVGLLRWVQMQSPIPLTLEGDQLLTDMREKLKESLQVFEKLVDFYENLMPTPFKPVRHMDLTQILLMQKTANKMEIRCFAMFYASRGTRIVLEVLSPFLEAVDAYIHYFISIS